MSKYQRRKLFDNLKNDTYCRIGVSTIPGAGVGVIAIKPIPKGINPFKQPCKRPQENIVYLSESDLKRLRPKVRTYIKDFFFPVEVDDQVMYPVVHSGLNSMDISYYLNHSQNPNLDMVADNSSYYDFRTNRDIKEGEELFIDYGHGRTS